MSYDSVYGKVVSGWKRVDGSVRYHIVIPANTEAEVTLPGEETRVLCAGKYDLQEVGKVFNHLFCNGLMMNKLMKI